MHHIDTLTLIISSLDILEQFYISPKSQNLNANQLFNPEYNVVYNNFVGTLNNKMDLLSYSIADTNVVVYNDSMSQFITKDTGSTYIIFNFMGKVDTEFIYLTTLMPAEIHTMCPNTSTTFLSGFNSIDSSYQWQVDTGGGFQNINNDLIYDGTNTSQLTLSNPPTLFSKYKFRCIANGWTGNEYTIRFSSNWMGSIDSTWENPLNWSCGSIPDINTVVNIDSGKPIYPVINSFANCKAIYTAPGATIKVNSGFKLNIAGNNVQ